MPRPAWFPLVSGGQGTGAEGSGCGAGKGDGGGGCEKCFAWLVSVVVLSL